MFSLLIKFDDQRHCGVRFVADEKSNGHAAAHPF